MIARLWWKDARQFWPIWALLIAFAMLAQWIGLHYFDEFVQGGQLAFMALGWTCLYAFAVGSAAFAGEREARTLGLLDTMPVERWRLWTGKASFALLTSLALGLLLFAHAAGATARWERLSPWWSIFYGAGLVTIIVGWGLFWSSFLANALAAAVLAIVTTLAAIPYMDASLQNTGYQSSSRLTVMQGAFGLLALAASAFLFIRTGPPARPLLRRRAMAASRREAALASAPMVVIVPSSDAESANRPVRYWPSAARSLLWQTWRQMLPVAPWIIILTAVGLFCLLVMTGPGDPLIGWVCLTAASLVTGVSVFGIETRTRSQLFFANEGVRPGLVWAVKLAAWLSMTAAIYGVPFLLSQVTGWRPPVFGQATPSPGNLAAVALLVPLATLAIPIVCGMAIRRGITAGLVALLIESLFLPILGMIPVGLMPTAFTFLIPLAILAIGFAWSGDWLLDRGGGRRWVNLAALSAGAFALLFVAYVVVRLEGIPRLDPQRAEQAFTIRSPLRVPESANAAQLYREVNEAMILIPGRAADEMLSAAFRPDKEAVKWADGNFWVREKIRMASLRPYCQLTPLDRATIFSPSYMESRAPNNFRFIQARLSISVYQRQHQGDLDGAWADIQTLFRLARQWSGPVPLHQALDGLNCEQTAFVRAFDWATDPKQTPARLHAALGDCYDWVAFPDPADTLRAEARIVENTLNMPRSEILENYSQNFEDQRADHYQRTFSRLATEFLTTPWELERARRGMRQILAAEIESAGLGAGRARRERARRVRQGYQVRFLGASSTEEWILQSTPLTALIAPHAGAYLADYDRNEVARRALPVIVRLRIWQLEHGGRLPSSFDKPLPEGLENLLPMDPYADDQPFRIVRATGQELLPLGDLTSVVPEGPGKGDRKPVTDAWLLYSIGPDGVDDRAGFNLESSGDGDIIFPLADNVHSKP